jgi:hypothetical protein
VDHRHGLDRKIEIKNARSLVCYLATENAHGVTSCASVALSSPYASSTPPPAIFISLPTDVQAAIES